MDIKATLKSLWEGDVPLVRTFWLYYFVGNLVLGMLAKAISPVFGIVSIVWIGFLVMPIWRSADKYSGNNLFALLAKIAAVLIALGVLKTLL